MLPAMGKGQHELAINRSADDVWKVVSDFGGLAAWMPGIESCELEVGFRLADVVGPPLDGFGRPVEPPVHEVVEAGEELADEDVPGEALRERTLACEVATRDDDALFVLGIDPVAQGLERGQQVV